MDWNKLIQSNWWVYTVCLISILICMVYYYNITDYEVKNTVAWENFVKECNCQCLMTREMFNPNITPEFNIPIYHEIMEEQDENKD